MLPSETQLDVLMRYEVIASDKTPGFHQSTLALVIKERVISPPALSLNAIQYALMFELSAMPQTRRFKSSNQAVVLNNLMNPAQWSVRLGDQWHAGCFCVNAVIIILSIRLIVMILLVDFRQNRHRMAT